VISEVSLIPWLLALAAAVLVLGYLTAVGCRNMTVAAAEREREAAEQSMRERISAVTRDSVLVPTGQEITQYERFRRELAVAKVLSVFPVRSTVPLASGRRLSLVARHKPPRSSVQDAGAAFGSRGDHSPRSPRSQGWPNGRCEGHRPFGITGFGF
jgi:hypothetical protein